MRGTGSCGGPREGADVGAPAAVGGDVLGAGEALRLDEEALGRGAVGKAKGADAEGSWNARDEGAEALRGQGPNLAGDGRPGAGGDAG